MRQCPRGKGELAVVMRQGRRHLAAVELPARKSHLARGRRQRQVGELAVLLAEDVTHGELVLHLEEAREHDDHQSQEGEPPSPG